jgi:indole-3-glycerol phosphate synthase
MTQPTILETIVAHKREEVAQRQASHPLDALRRRLASPFPIRDFATALRRSATTIPPSTALIAEVKKGSPSRGVLLEDFDHRHIAQTYMEHGASAISVLTDERFFLGHLSFLQDIRQLQETLPPPHAAVPLLRKDFLIDPYQVFEARTAGADAVLLIVGVLDDETLSLLLETTHELGMHALVEAHNEEELTRALAAGAKIVGINNRDLHTFHTTLETTERLISLLPTLPTQSTQLIQSANDGDRPIVVSESGIYTPSDVVRLRGCGVNAILVGEALVVSEDIGEQVRTLAMA